MVFVKILLVGMITVFVTMILKGIKFEFAVLVGVVGSVVMLIMISDEVGKVLAFLNDLFEHTSIDGKVVSTLFKIIGVGYITEFAANICSDAGSASVGDKLLFCGKITIFIMSIPIISGLMNIILGLIQ